MKIDISLFIFNDDIKDRTPDGNDRGWRIDPVGVGLSTKFFDLNARLAFNYVDQISGRFGQILNLNCTFRANDNLRAISQSKNQSSISTSDDDIFGKEQVLRLDHDRDGQGQWLYQWLTARPTSNLDLALDRQNTNAHWLLPHRTDSRDDQDREKLDDS
jgi:hypothetical protein